MRSTCCRRSPTKRTFWTKSSLLPELFTSLSGMPFWGVSPPLAGRFGGLIFTPNQPTGEGPNFSQEVTEEVK